jgi:hypothetical protein
MKLSYLVCGGVQMKLSLAALPPMYSAIKSLGAPDVYSTESYK